MKLGSRLAGIVLVVLDLFAAASAVADETPTRLVLDEQSHTLLTCHPPAMRLAAEGIIT
jgi:hypothetical protein